MTNSLFSALGATLAYATLSFSSAAQDNVMVILVDDMGVDTLGAYAEGAAPPPTPNIDGLAANGVLFRNAWSNPVCSPTRACIQTGRYALRTLVGHIITRSGLMQPREMTIPEVLDAGASGYAHAAFGKWHLGNFFDVMHPNNAGWSHFAGMIGGATPNYFAWARTVNGDTELTTTYATTQIVDDVLAWVGTQTGPWVTYVAFNAPHDPFHFPPAGLHTQNLAGLNPSVTPGPFHTAAIEALDNEIGRLLGGLGVGLANTNIIFMGDNGTDRRVVTAPFIPFHGKASLYEGGINVPLIVSGPAVVSPGREVSALVGAVDVFATVTELAGVTAAPLVPATLELDSVSFAPYLADPLQTPLRTFAYAEIFDGVLWTQVNGNGGAAIRNETHKLIRYYSAGPAVDELYDLVADPFEINDLLLGGPLQPAEQAALTALQTELDRLRSPAGAMNPFGPTACMGTNGNPAVGGTGNPGLGQTYTVTLTNGAINRPATLLIGLSDTAWGALSLPFPLQLLGAGAGCVLRTSSEASVPLMTDANGDASLPLTVPDEDFLVGIRLYHSWLINDPGAPNNRLSATVTNGLVVLIGT